MARRLTAASSQSFSSLTTPITGLPLTIAAWFKPASTGANSVILCLGDSGSSTNLIELYYDATAQAMQMYDGGVQAQSPTGINSTSTWYHVAGRASSGSLDSAKNGTFGSAGAGVAQTVNAIYLGAQRFSGALSGFCDGALAEVGLWNVALAQSEITSLSLGYSPLMIRPQNLVDYWDCIGRGTNEIDWMGSAALTNTNGSTVVDHPPIIYPGSGFMYAVPSAGGPVDVPANLSLPTLGTGIYQPIMAGFAS